MRSPRRRRHRSPALHNCAIAHCPTSNMKLASGAAPVARLLDRGPERRPPAPTAPPATTGLDLFREMQQASLLAKLTTGDAAAPARPPRPAHGHPGRRTSPRPRPPHRLLPPARPPTWCAVRVSPTPTRYPASTRFRTSSTCSTARRLDVWVAGQPSVQGGRLLQITNTELIEHRPPMAE